MNRQVACIGSMAPPCIARWVFAGVGSSVLVLFLNLAASNSALAQSDPSRQELAIAGQTTSLPGWYPWTALAVLGIMAFLVGFSLLLRRQVRAQTRTLLEDIERRKQAEEALRATNTRLEETLTALRVAQAQMVRQERMAAVGQLADGIAHDFNNILVPILGYAELGLMRSAPDSKLFGDLTQIRKAAERGAILTRQILAFSRSQVVETQELDLNAVIGDFLKMFERLLAENVMVKPQLSPDLDPICGNKVQIEQALMTLALNARAAMPAGGALTIATSNVVLDAALITASGTAAAGRYVVLAMSDTGEGAPAETNGRIIDHFSATGDEAQGVGLSLFTVLDVVQQHAGYMVVTQEPAGGNVFKLYFPPMLPAAARGNHLGKTRATPARGDATVLVAEDEQLARQLICETLRTQGYRVIEAENPEEALRLATEEDGPIDLLLTDVLMPQMNGRQLAEKVALIHPDVRILYVSGYDADVLSRQGALDPGIHLLLKPFTVQRLMEKMDEVLHMAQVAA